MIRVLLIYVAALTAFIVAGTVATGTPLEQVAWLVLLVEVVPLATLGGAMLIRRMMRQPRRDDWQRLGCDPVSRLPVTRVTAEPVYRIETTYGHCYSNQPPLQIEAPRREMTQWHNGD
jgi:hypothetical protein